MKTTIHLALLLALLGLTLPASQAQSDDNSTPLGDIARALRKDKDKEKQSQPAATPTVIDNDNLPKVMEQAESERLKGNNVKIAFEGSGRDLRVNSPDVTCNLSFNAQSGALEADPITPEDLPRSELSKLDGPAAISGDSLEVTVHNGSGWNVKEITIGLTILRGPDANAAYYGTAKLLPAAAGAAAGGDAPAEKRSDLTVLYHLKGAAAPFSTAVFRQSLGVNLSPDQDWHWAIVQAQGIPPR